MTTVKAKDPFRFYTRLHLQELTGLTAIDLKELLAHIKTVPGSVIYHHTHRFLQIHLSHSPEPPNDFAWWISDALGESELAEKLASIDTVSFPTIRSLREKIIETIQERLSRKDRPLRCAVPEEAFQFVKTVSFILPTPYRAYDLEEFSRILRKVSINSIYYHVFEARLRLERQDNDFSFWLDCHLGEREIAKEISRLDPYNFTFERLRGRIIEIVEKGARA